MNIQKDEILKNIDLLETYDKSVEYYQQILWKTWVLNAEFKNLANLSVEEKKQVGWELSTLKNVFEQAFWQKQKSLREAEINASLEKDTIDIFTPNKKNSFWKAHILQREVQYIQNIFHWMWFMIETWPAVVSKWENFYSVNIPASHPATEMHDTFYLQDLESENSWAENLVLRTQTSAMQVNLMRKYGTPLRIIVPWKVFRYENMDASHDTAFWQLEWILVDEKISIANFKDIFEKFFSAYFWKEIKLRMRPGYFPFVEPGFEIDVSCPICEAKGCSLCKQAGWIELLWAWMIHPNVLKNWWLEWKTGFAFGMWVNRLVAIKYNIKDIRLFTNWDMRFLESI